jgi:hypothetical protein
MRAVKVIINGVCTATKAMEDWNGLRDVLDEYFGIAGAEIRPAEGEVFEGSRCTRYEFKNGAWWVWVRPPKALW